MEAQFGRLGLYAERVPALTGAGGAALREHGFGASHLADVEIAVNISHRRAWERFLGTDAPAALVLEDDAVLADSLVGLLEWDSYAQAGADLVKLETFRRPVRQASLGRRRLGGPFRMRRLLSGHIGSAAYLISRSAAERSVHHEALTRLTIDVFLFDARGPHLRQSPVFQVSPAPCVQLMFTSRGKQDDTARSDLSQGRRQRMAAPPKRKKEVLGLIERVKGWAWTLRHDPLAPFVSRQLVAFAGDESTLSGAGR